MTRVVQRCFATTVLCAVALSAAAFPVGTPPAANMMKMDTNGDGMLSAAEHEAGARQMFTMMDANKDGSVTAAEMQVSHKTMAHDSWQTDQARSKDGKSKEVMQKDADSGK